MMNRKARAFAQLRANRKMNSGGSLNTAFIIVYQPDVDIGGMEYIPSASDFSYSGQIGVIGYNQGQLMAQKPLEAPGKMVPFMRVFGR
jgi:hypothetical protein